MEISKQSQHDTDFYLDEFIVLYTRAGQADRRVL